MININIQVDQIGYRPNDVKIATFRIGDTKSISDSVNVNGSLSNTFRVIDTINHEVIYEGNLSETSQSDYTGEVNKTADFSKVKRPGQYMIEGGVNGTSCNFEIKDDVYDELLKSTVKMFYMQRCGVELKSEYAGIYAHPVCHESNAKIYGTDKYKDVSGGWHDAGDYGRYTVAAAKSVVDLMMAYEYFPDIMTDSYQIPESNNKVPDIIDEIKFELDWMLKMQDEETGGVYHKVTCAGFPGFVMPEDEREELIVAPMSDTATADFAAAMAYAYRIFSALPKKYGSSAVNYANDANAYLRAANFAMDFLERGGCGTFTNPPEIVTGEYSDNDCMDEIFWANAEMFKTTGERVYEEKLKQINLNEVKGEFGWKEVGDYGFVAYLTSKNDKDKNLRDAVYQRLLSENEQKLKNFKEDAYSCSIYGNYYWGCNMEIANNAMRAIILDKIDGNDNYKEMISAQLHYLLGNNPNGKCFVTGFGKDSPMHPHHRPSIAKNSPMPGMLVGGPEPKMLDDVAKRLLNGFPPAKCYIDDTESYSTNEITIYWNSPLVFLLAYMCSGAV